MVNVNNETKIAFGCVSYNKLNIDVVDPIYWQAYESYKNALITAGYYKAEDFDDDEGLVINEPTGAFEFGGVKGEMFWLGGAPMLLIMESPIVTSLAPKCSPCVPNAGDLDSMVAFSSNRPDCMTYSIPNSWWADEDEFVNVIIHEKVTVWNQITAKVPRRTYTKLVDTMDYNTTSYQAIQLLDGCDFDTETLHDTESFITSEVDGNATLELYIIDPDTGDCVAIKDNSSN